MKQNKSKSCKVTFSKEKKLFKAYKYYNLSVNVTARFKLPLVSK